MSTTLAIVMLVGFLSIIGLCVWAAVMGKKVGATAAQATTDSTAIKQANASVKLQQEYQDAAATSDDEVLNGLNTGRF